MKNKMQGKTKIAMMVIFESQEDRGYFYQSDISFIGKSISDNFPIFASECSQVVKYWIIRTFSLFYCEKKIPSY